MLIRHSIFRLLCLLTLLSLSSGCSWTPRVETSIYKGSQGSVSLITVPEESFEADHPVTLQPDTIAHVLRGLQIQRSPRLLQKIFSGEAAPQRILTDEQVALLTPPLQKAFSQVTPEEHIIFHAPGNPETGIRSIKGTLYVQGDNLHVILTFPEHSSHTSTKSTGKGVRPDHEGQGLPLIVFSPQEALRPKKQSHGLGGGGKTNHVVINVPRLASLYKEHPPHTRQTEKEMSTVSSSSPDFEGVTPPETDEAATTRSAQQPASAHTPNSPGTQTLIEEIKALRKELAEQKKAIERLKHEKE